MTDEERPTLEEEGIPDHEGPLAAKERTGDPQEGVPPPADRPSGEEHGTTVAEQREGEPLGERLDREEPDEGVVGFREDAGRLVEDGAEPTDVEKDVVGRETRAEEALSAEEAAMRVVDDAPGATEGPDGYVGGPE